MTTHEILHVLQSEIHSTVFATLDSQGLPQTCVIDLLLPYHPKPEEVAAPAEPPATTDTTPKEPKS